ncbi:MAG: SDR family NAD(P)-dependent oxidoreductase [Flavobacteriales bacterium]|nr:SDR family NAD(P)-dependent oxidoreductase [Flavobacteriales bacterium]
MSGLAVISGATRGIGRNVAILLAQKGYHLALASRSQEDLAELKREILEINANAQVLITRVNFSEKSDIDFFTKYVLEKWSKVDIIINNVGVYNTDSVLDFNMSDLNETLRINFFSAIHLTSPFLDQMIRSQTGYIFNICSVLSKIVRPKAASYSISKHALLAYSKLLQEEFRGTGIKVTSIIPGSTNTSSWGEANVPREQFVQPEDIADLIWTCIQSKKGTFPEELIIQASHPEY